jgi:YjjG family noncanonical pyrimidine nucleotidase
MHFTNLLFDADDTLFDFPKASGNAFRVLCESERIPCSEASYRIYCEVNQVLWDAFDRGEVSKEALVIQRFVRFLDRLGLDRSPEQCNATYLDALGRSAYPLPNAEAVCRTLSGTHRLYLVTNAVASVQRSRLLGSVFADFITAAFISEEAGSAKPSAAYFDYVLARIPGASKENCLMIGDSIATDIRGANNAGLSCCWYNPKGLPRPGDLRIDWEIRDLRELYQIV